MSAEEDDGFPVSMFLRIAGGMVLAFLSAIGGATIIGAGLPPEAALLGVPTMGLGMAAGVWLISTALPEADSE